MSPQDFLHIHARTDRCQRFAVANLAFGVTTNSEALLESLGNVFPGLEGAVAVTDLSLRLWVDENDLSKSPWPQPYVRGLDHRVFAGFDTKSSILADLRTRRISGRFSPAMAADALHWRSIVLPVLMSVVSSSLGLVELHASCVARGDRGLVLLGPSRSGKSTLAWALARAGFRLLSDDRVFCFLRDGSVEALALPRPLKLRREASTWFAELNDRRPTLGPNGDPVFYCETSNAARVATCEPDVLIFLEQQREPAFRICQLDRSEARMRIEADLLAESPEAIQMQDKVLDRLTALPCWRLQYNGSPHSIAEKVVSAVFDVPLSSNT